MGIRGNISRRVATVVLLGAAVLAPAPAQASTTCPTVNGITPTTCITSVTLSRATAAVSGGATVPLTVAIGIHSDPGVPSGRVSQSNGTGQPRDLVPELYFNIRLNNSSGRDRLGLALASGDAHDGVWRGTINISALDAGTMTTSYVTFGGLGQPPLPRQTIPVELRRSVVVSASHIPRFEGPPVVFSPYTLRAGMPFTAQGRVVDLHTGAGMPRITVSLQEPDQACDCFVGRYAATTDVAGYWQVHVPRLTTSEYHASIEGPINSDGRRPDIDLMVGNPHVLGSITATLSTRTAHPGDAVLVTGTASPTGGRSMYLEKWVNHAWTRVCTSPLRTSGRFTLPAKPSAPGHWEYRVTDIQANATSAILSLVVS